MVSRPLARVMTCLMVRVRAVPGVSPPGRPAFLAEDKTPKHNYVTIANWATQVTLVVSCETSLEEGSL